MVVPFPKSSGPPFSITKIPGIMRTLGWLNGAALMEEWFNNAENNDPSKGTPDTTTITMDKWALTFARAKTAYDDLMAKKIWLNLPARDLLLQRLRAAGKITEDEETFGDVSGLTMPQVDAQQINFKAVGGGLSDKLFDPLDDLFAALAAFTFKVIVQGRVGPSDSLQPPLTHRVTIEKVGVYIRDSYDFNGPQFLGSWRETPPACSKDPLAFPPYNPTHNADFGSWRTANHRGGDFLVFSDIKFTTLATPDSFSFNGGI
jgi:hypothetical protein